MRMCGGGARMRWLAGWLLLAGLLLAPVLACARGTADGPVLVLGDSLSAEHNIPAGSGCVSLLERRLAQARPPGKVVKDGPPMGRQISKLVGGLIGGKADGMAFLQELVP